MTQGRFLGIYRGQRVWLLPDGRIEVMFKDRPIEFAPEAGNFKAAFWTWLQKRDAV